MLLYLAIICSMIFVSLGQLELVRVVRLDLMVVQDAMKRRPNTAETRAGLASARGRTGVHVTCDSTKGCL